MVGTVAQTIQGEAGGNPANQFAVASVIYNRLQAGGYGGTTASQIVNAPLQFTGSASPNPSAQMFAQAIESGTLSQYGNTGNAVNFASGQTASNVGLTQGGANIGGNYFSDNWGPPSSSFQAPSYGASTTGSSSDGSYGDPNISISQAGDTSGQTSTGATLGPGEGDFGGPTGVDAPGTYTLPNPLGAGAGDQIPSTAGSDPTGSGGGATGATVSSSPATGLGAILNYFTDKGIRFLIIVLGIILVAVAGWGFVKGDIDKEDLAKLMPKGGVPE